MSDKHKIKKDLMGASVAIGAVIGVLTDNLGLWIAVGVAIGTSVGAGLSAQQKKEIDD